MTDTVRVYHVEDYQIMRDGIRFLLSQDPEIQLVGQSTKGEELLEALKSLKVDVVVLDLYLDSMDDVKPFNGFEICKLVQENYPGTKIVAHSVYDDADRVAKILKAGASGFVSKKSGFQELLQAIKTVHSGGIYICPETSGRLKNLNQFLMGIEDKLRDKEQLFSHREREVLELLARGLSSKEIAATLFITERTVESHRKNMIEKGGVKNTVELIAYAASLGLLKD